MIEKFVLAQDLCGILAAEAQAAFPCECCGLIEGMRKQSVVRALALHPTRNLATLPERFEIDPAAHIALLKSLRGSGREIVGCYHSHPNGAAELSARDRQGAFEENFLWLVIAIVPNNSANNPPLQDATLTHPIPPPRASVGEVASSAEALRDGGGAKEISEDAPSVSLTSLPLQLRGTYNKLAEARAKAGHAFARGRKKGRRRSADERNDESSSRCPKQFSVTLAAFEPGAEGARAVPLTVP